MNKVSEGLLVRQLEVGKLAVFCYMVSDRESGEGLVIDPGGDTAKVLHTAYEDGVEVRFVVNTHSHTDHICGNAEVVRETGAKLVIHELERMSLTRVHKRLLNRLLGGRHSPRPRRPAVRRRCRTPGSSCRRQRRRAARRNAATARAIGY